MAPEVKSKYGHKFCTITYGFSVDIYALGVIIHDLSGIASAGTLRNQLTNLADRNMLNEQPEQRYTATQVKQALSVMSSH